MNVTPQIEKLDNGSYFVTPFTKAEERFFDAFFAAFAEFERLYYPTDEAKSFTENCTEDFDH
jgi:hypothetical protein